MSADLAKLTPLVVMVVIVAIGAAYMLFLVATWQQVQRDRSMSLAKIDQILDRIAPSPVTETSHAED